MLSYYLTLIVALGIYMTIWYGVSQAIRRTDVADIAWGFGFPVIAWAAYILGNPDKIPALIINVLVTTWGLRLAIHIALRNRGKPDDKRYVEMRQKWGAAANRQTYTHVFLAQGALLLVIVAPVIIANQFHIRETIIMPWQMLGVLVWFTGFFFESVGDWQLKRFLADPTYRGQLMTSGLWRYSRHPNYFGEVTQWWGIFLMSLAAPAALIGIIGPITISYLILKVSGIPMLERNMKNNPAFADYARRTSAFFPRKPRR